MAISQASTSQENAPVPERGIPLSFGQRFFNRYTIKTTMPNRPLMERLLAIPRNVYDWLKFEVFIPLTERVILLVSPISPLDRLIEQEQKALRREYSNSISNITLNWKERLLGYQHSAKAHQANYEIDNLENKLNKHINDVMSRNQHLTPTQKMRLLRSLLDTLDAISLSDITGALSEHWPFDRKHISPSANNIYDAIERIVLVLDNRIKDTIQGGIASISGTLRQCQDDLNLSEKSIIRILRGNRQFYKSVIADLSSAPEEFIGTHEPPITVPRQFNADLHRSAYVFRAGNSMPRLELPQVTGASTEQKRKKETDFMERLQLMTQNNGTAGYTITAHLTQSAKNIVSGSCRAIFNHLGLSVEICAEFLDYETVISVDESNTNKIIIQQICTIKHHKDRPEENSALLQRIAGCNPDFQVDDQTGPNSLLLSSLDNRTWLLSNYRQAWLDMTMRFESRVTVDLNEPEYALVEQMDPYIHLP